MFKNLICEIMYKFTIYSQISRDSTSNNIILKILFQFHKYYSSLDIEENMKNAMKNLRYILKLQRLCSAHAKI